MRRPFVLRHDQARGSGRWHLVPDRQRHYIERHLRVTGDDGRDPVNITDIRGSVALRNGVQMPYLGLGVFEIPEGKAIRKAVLQAFSAGYRHIDTAAAYGNERGVGDALRESGLSRNEVFITTKVWNSDQGYEQTLNAFDASMKRLGMEILDLYLVHWPVKGKFVDTWKALERLYEEKRIRAIGVSNFLRHHLDELLSACTIAPMVNQMEFHPYLVQQPLLDLCHTLKIQYEAWSPLMQGRISTVPELRALGAKYAKDPAQIVLRWNLQKGVVTIPKSANPARILSNAQLFDFALSADEVTAIDNLDRHTRIGADPDTFNF
jgi:diketogulonate reductase-like aldo/keto reductase